VVFLGHSIFICAAFLIATVGLRYVFWYPRNDLELDTKQASYFLFTVKIIKFWKNKIVGTKLVFRWSTVGFYFSSKKLRVFILFLCK